VPSRGTLGFPIGRESEGQRRFRDLGRGQFCGECGPENRCRRRDWAGNQKIMPAEAYIIRVGLGRFAEVLFRAR
jgi:hypothetical protein